MYKMKGYNTLKQFVQDYKLYLTATKVDPGRTGETITSYLKKRMRSRFRNASKQFNNMIKKRQYSVNDLKLIATHDTIGRMHNLEFFVKECFGINYVNEKHYRKLMSSNAFQSGRLKRLYQFLPNKIKTKTEFLRFLRSKYELSKSELTVIMNQVCENNWRIWLNELLDKGKIQDKGNRWRI